MAGTGNSTRAIFFALGANAAIAVAKGAAAFFTGSSAMLAETVHSLADCGNQGLLLLGMKKATAPPSPEHPLGHGREVYFWSFLVAVMLFTVGGMFSLYEGLHKLQATEVEPGGSLWWAVAVLVFAIVAEGISMRTCLQEVNKSRGDRSLWRWFRESRQAELVLATIATGNPLWDALGTLAIGALLIVVAVLVAIEVKAMLVGQSVDPERQRQIRQFLDGRPEIVRVISLITMQLGNEAMVSVQAHMREEGDVSALVSLPRGALEFLRTRRAQRRLSPRGRRSDLTGHCARGRTRGRRQGVAGVSPSVWMMASVSPPASATPPGRTRRFRPAPCAAAAGPRAGSARIATGD